MVRNINAVIYNFLKNK